MAKSFPHFVVLLKNYVFDFKFYVSIVIVSQVMTSSDYIWLEIV